MYLYQKDKRALPGNLQSRKHFSVPPKIEFLSVSLSLPFIFRKRTKEDRGTTKSLKNKKNVERDNGERMGRDRGVEEIRERKKGG
jgi:hypothetical protein